MIAPRRYIPPNVDVIRHRRNVASLDQQIQLDLCACIQKFRPTTHLPSLHSLCLRSGPATPWESSSSLLFPRELLASNASSTTSSMSAVSGFANSNVTEEARGSSTSFSMRRGTSQTSSSGSVITDPFLLSLARVQGTDLDSIGSGSVHKSTGSVHDQVQDQNSASPHGDGADTASHAPSGTSLHVSVDTASKHP